MYIAGKPDKTEYTWKPQPAPCQRHTTLEIQLLRPWHRPSLGPAQGPAPKRVPFLDQKRGPQTMSPNSGGTYFGGCKVDLKSGPYLAAVKRSLLLEFSGRMYLHAATRQRSNGSDGSRSVPEALLCAYGKPDRAGGPVTNTSCDVWKPVHAGGHVVYTWEAQQCGRPTTRVYIHMEAGLGRRPSYVYM